MIVLNVFHAESETVHPARCEEISAKQ